MGEINSILYSKYIINGDFYDISPIDMLCATSGEEKDITLSKEKTIIDETCDYSPSMFKFDKNLINDYLKKIINNTDNHLIFNNFSTNYTQERIATSLINTIWQYGHFKLNNLKVNLEWNWQDEGIGNLSSFYFSVNSACEFINNLDIKLNKFKLIKERKNSLNVNTEINYDSLVIDDKVLTIEKGHIPQTISNQKNTWLIYIPFDTSKFKLGGSTLSAIYQNDSGSGISLEDTAYFIDCYEVIRELVEDNVILSGITTQKGGLATALYKLFDGGFQIDVNDICQAYKSDTIPVLFGEMPGVVIEINDYDYDYVDAELLLQDIAYFPLGEKNQMINNKNQVELSNIPKINDILNTILNNKRDTL